jgi:hypothetical protein
LESILGLLQSLKIRAQFLNDTYIDHVPDDPKLGATKVLLDQLELLLLLQEVAVLLAQARVDLGIILTPRKQQKNSSFLSYSLALADSS